MISDPIDADSLPNEILLPDKPAYHWLRILADPRRRPARPLRRHCHYLIPTTPVGRHNPLYRRNPDTQTCSRPTCRVSGRNRLSAFTLFVVVRFQLNDKLHHLRRELFSLIRHRIVPSKNDDNSTIREKLITSFW